MTAYSVYEARNNLSKLIAAAQSGEEVVIENRGRPSVRLVPAQTGGSRSAGAFLGWLDAHPMAARRRADPDEIEARIRETREAWA